jgi:predicted RNase H-like HicB family nuclease
MIRREKWSTPTAILRGVEYTAGAREVTMIRDYIDAALERARCTQLEDGSYCAEVRGLRGAIATGATLESCRSQPQEVVEEWILVRVARGLDIPVLAGG